MKGTVPNDGTLFNNRLGPVSSPGIITLEFSLVI